MVSLFSVHIRNEKLIEIETAMSRKPMRSINPKNKGQRLALQNESILLKSNQISQKLVKSAHC
jgi:hypothetical protein